MRLTISALFVAAGIAGFGVAAQAAPASPSMQLGASTAAPTVQVQMHRRRVMRHRMMRHRMMRRRMHRM